MQWLMAHMWMALAAMSALGLLFGWSVRGLRLNGRLRRVEGERNIIAGTLAEKEAELEAFYAAGRAPAEISASPANGNEDELRAALSDREARLQALTDELARTKAELGDLRTSTTDVGQSSVGTMVAAAAAGAAASAAGGDASASEAERLDAGLNKDDASLQWRNRYLDSRIRTLQDKVQELAGSREAQGLAGGAAQVRADVAEDGTGDVVHEKLKWQNDYLRQRIRYAERYGTHSATAGEIAPPSPVVAINTLQSDADEDTGATDQELAKLRWRNRYLEGRLAYYEGDKGIPAQENAAESDSGIGQLAGSVAAVGVGATGIATLSDDSDEVAEDTAFVPFSDDTEDPVLATDISAALDLDDAGTEEVGEFKGPEDDNREQAEDQRGTAPISLDGPVNGEGDDLTAIGGIGPKIEEVLNGLGIYHYDQIAAWTPENIEWVDDHLAFEGRIEREQWVQQAASLSGDS